MLCPTHPHFWFLKCTVALLKLGIRFFSDSILIFSNFLTPRIDLNTEFSVTLIFVSSLSERVHIWHSYVNDGKTQWVVLQKLSQLSDTHFSQVLNKFSSKLYKFPPPQTTTAWILRSKVPSPRCGCSNSMFLIFIYPWYQWLPTFLKNQKITILLGHWGICWPITRPLKGHCMASKRDRNSVAWFFFPSSWTVPFYIFI